MDVFGILKSRNYKEYDLFDKWQSRDFEKELDNGNRIRIFHSTKDWKRWTVTVSHDGNPVAVTKSREISKAVIDALIEVSVSSRIAHDGNNEITRDFFFLNSSVDELKHFVFEMMRLGIKSLKEED